MIKIEEFTEEYRQDVIDLWKEICVDEFHFYNWLNGIENFDNHLFKNNNGKFYIALDENKLIGTISLENKENNIGKLKSFYVKKEYRSQKIGYYLMNIIFDDIRELKYKQIYLDTYSVFVDAIKFYNRFGFEKIDDDGIKLVFKKNIE